MKYLLIVFSLLLLTSCGESEADIKKRKHLERIENLKKSNTNTSTVTNVTNVTKVKSLSAELDEPTIVDGLKDSDFEWDRDDISFKSNGALIINDHFTLRAKTHSDNVDVVYSLFRNGQYTGNWALHSQFKDNKDPITDIIEHVLHYYKRDHVNKPVAFKFN